MKKRPHVILFNPDQMRSDVLHHLGNPAAITPHLDAFAANDAVSFSNAFCQNPVCTPSRCSFLTGLYPHVHGQRTMTHMLHQDQSSILQQMKEAGYHVWMTDRNDFLPAQVDGILIGTRQKPILLSAPVRTSPYYPILVERLIRPATTRIIMANCRPIPQVSIIRAMMTVSMRPLT